MIHRNILGLAISISMFVGTSIGQVNGHGTHVAGTIGAVGNNGVASGGHGRDVLLGGAGTDLEAGTINLTSFAGQTIRLRIATVNNSGSLFFFPPFSIEIG